MKKALVMTIFISGGLIILSSTAPCSAMEENEDMEYNIYFDELTKLGTFSNEQENDSKNFNQGVEALDFEKKRTEFELMLKLLDLDYNRAVLEKDEQRIDRLNNAKVNCNKMLWDIMQLLELKKMILDQK